MTNTIILHKKSNLKIENIKKYFRNIISKFKENSKKEEEIKTLNLANIEIYSKKLKLPKDITGSLILSDLKTISKNISFPRKIGKNLYLESLVEIPKDFNFPEVGGNIYLRDLENYPKKFNFPKNVIFTYDE